MAGSDAGQLKALLRRKYEFRWDVLDIIVSGKSSIDSVQGFQIRTREEADRFLMSYGYDLENPIEKAHATGHFHEALNFIKRYFLAPDNPEGLKIDLPRKIQELQDIRDLFLMANIEFPGQQRDASGHYIRNWACAILKVMHTIAHVDQDLRSGYFADIQKQILDRFYRVIHRESAVEEQREGILYLGEKADDPLRVNLVAFETKPKKSRDSTLIKLLHKPENVAEDIFDRVGLRIVTQSRLDALRVVKFMKERHIVMPPNIKPSRSRNTLVDLDSFRPQLDEALTRVDRGELDEVGLVRELERAAMPPSVNPENPHSSEFYRAIQFTARQMIKLKSPLYDDLRELKTQLKGGKLQEDTARIVERIDLKYVQREVRFFYPFEIQVVDLRSFEDNEKGRSAHKEYKNAQLQTAMKRVMGALAVTSAEMNR